MSSEPAPQPEIENLLRRGAHASRRTRRSRPRPTRRPALYAEAEADFEAFWAKRARERLRWTEPFDTTLEWDLPFAKWFLGGRLNVSENCLDRHVENGLGDKVAYHWIGEPGDTRTLTYADLLREVGKAANALKELGVETGDRVAIYMPMIPELPIAMLACARLGAAHTVIFGGFSAEALSDRINDAQAKVLITADGGWRRGKAGRAQAPRRRGAGLDAPRSTGTIVVSRLGDGVHMVDGPRPLVARHRRSPGSGLPARPGRQRAAAVPALHLGHDGQAQGHHPHLGRLPARAPRSPTRSSSTSSPTTCTGARPTSAGSPATATSSTARWPTRRPGVMYEGAPDTPDWDRWWQIVEDYKVTILYCAPTAIRAFMKQGEAYPATPRPVVAARPRLGRRADQSRGLAVVPAATSAAAGRPIVDTWWQTETGSILITPAARGHDHQAGLGDLPAARASWPTWSTPTARVRAARRRRLPRPQAALAAMLRGIYGDPERYRATYWSRFPGMYFAGDGAKRDERGLLLAARPGRRRDERGRPPDQHDRGRVGPGRPPQRGRGGGRRQERRDQRPGDLRLRDPARPAIEPIDALAVRAARARRLRDRPDRPARSS